MPAPSEAEVEAYRPERSKQSSFYKFLDQRIKDDIYTESPYADIKDVDVVRVWL